MCIIISLLSKLRTFPLILLVGNCLDEFLLSVTCHTQAAEYNV